MNRLDLSAKGNKQILELYFESSKQVPAAYNAHGLWQKQKFSQSVGILQVI